VTAKSHAQDGSSCTQAIPMGVNNFTIYTADTTAATNWMTSFGPLVSPSHDLVYTFTPGPNVAGRITPISSNYAFALYLIPSCASGAEPVPIGATATIGVAIDVAAAGVISGNTYYLAVTGIAAGGPGANGTVMFGDSWIAVTLQSFEID